VRGIPAGTLEQVVLRLDVLHALRELGVPVYNDARAIERTVDKGMTSFLFGHAGVPTPPTCVTESPARARAFLLRQTAAGHAVVVKPLFGSQGVGLRCLEPGTDIPDAAECNGVWYLQQYIETGAHDGDWHDWRVFVIAGVAVAAMVRRGATWVNNVAQGGGSEAAALEPGPARVAVRGGRDSRRSRESVRSSPRPGRARSSCMRAALGPATRPGRLRRKPRERWNASRERRSSSARSCSPPAPAPCASRRASTLPPSPCARR